MFGLRILTTNNIELFIASHTTILNKSTAQCSSVLSPVCVCVCVCGCRTRRLVCRRALGEGSARRERLLIEILPRTQ